MAHLKIGDMNEVSAIHTSPEDVAQAFNGYKSEKQKNMTIASNYYSNKTTLKNYRSPEILYFIIQTNMV